jgi:hypothetical protein
MGLTSKARYESEAADRDVSLRELARYGRVRSPTLLARASRRPGARNQIGTTIAAAQTHHRPRRPALEDSSSRHTSRRLNRLAIRYGK